MTELCRLKVKLTKGHGIYAPVTHTLADSYGKFWIKPQLSVEEEGALFLDAFARRSYL